ncbi:hypothetical protein WG78_07945 [Amantichitinum ursilacus]|uniref:MoxR-vWA-beta-propeller ternary system domain-containing protein n=1 Tax=Amantichitinum ursilacus TaxID=857265 RepID=A0A0N0XLI3_9NEIS|nr:hypothetical protein WG78_07945 [Amantichitinum ursilacus]
MRAAVTHNWTWRAATQPATPAAAVGWGDTALALHARLLALSAEHQSRLHMTAGPEVLVVLGVEGDLPWISGVAYAAPSPLAPALWLPTAYEPTMAHDLLAQALAHRYGAGSYLLWHAPALAMPLQRQVPVSPSQLAHFAAQRQGQRV